MLRSVYDFQRFTIAATDGSLGRVGDLYFDDRDWAVRYLAVDADDWLPGHRVLVSPMSLRRSEPTTLCVAFRKQQVTANPGGAVTRVVPVSAPPGEVDPTILARAGESGEVHLQNATVVLGHAVQAEDGEIGRVKDVLVERLGNPLPRRRHPGMVGRQESPGVAGMVHPRDVGRVEDAVLPRQRSR